MARTAGGTSCQWASSGGARVDPTLPLVALEPSLCGWSTAADGRAGARLTMSSRSPSDPTTPTPHRGVDYPTSALGLLTEVGCAVSGEGGESPRPPQRPRPHRPSGPAEG